MRDAERALDDMPRTPVRARTILTSLGVGIVVGVLGAFAIAPPRGARFEARLPWVVNPPTQRDWPHAPLPGETARLEAREQGVELVVTARSAGEARGLSRAFAARHAPSTDDLTAAYERTRAAWREPAATPAPAKRTRNVDCAAVLLARSRWGRDLARDLPLAAPNRPTPDPSVPLQVQDAWLNVTWVVDERDAALLMAAVVEATRLDSRWFADTAAWGGWTTTARGDAWRRWQRSRAKLLQPITSQLLTWEEPGQRAQADPASMAQLAALDDRLGFPWESFASNPASPVRPLVRPIAAVWLPPLLVGAGAGSLAALFALLMVAVFRPASPEPEPLGSREQVAELDAPTPNLHIVTGARPSVVMRAALELAAHRMAAGDRVLLVDASPRLHLHERLNRDARWGLLECLAADMPVLGLVQYAGHPGLYLLPHGQAERAVGWSQLGRKLDEVLPFFGRIVLVVDPHSPVTLGDALRGRPMEGWWAEDEPRPRRALENAMSRLGIAFRRLYLEVLPEASLEALAERVVVLRPPGVRVEPAPIAAPARFEPPVAPRPALEPIVLDCDLQVRQRLRFLAWMRKVQAEEGRARIQA